LLSGGHGPTLFVSGANGNIRDLGSQGLPLGLLEDQLLDDPVEATMDPGDLIVAVSDGFFEWANASRELFGIDRLQQVIQSHRHESAAAILSLMEQEVKKFAGNVPQQDDVTGLVIKRRF
jgi:phosphoserine phosphatase